ncbi:MAG: sulfoxide reductase heme-binding subunit YedZ [Betaproteobacteria bacterium]|nr:sulfoxide reductase heme-binding subunit YedZ [Betaproteobacteria bacterium]
MKSGPLGSISVQKAIVIIICLLPLVNLARIFVFEQPADPYEVAAHITGETALRLLIITLAITPIRSLTGWKRLGIFRRNLGVLSFCYALCHVFFYMWLEAGFSPAYLIDDLAERRYISAGFAAFVMMTPLAVTSNNFSVRKLGALWRKLHRLMYPLCIAACIHYLWLVRGEDAGPFVYLAIVLALLAARVIGRMRRQGSAARA